VSWRTAPFTIDPMRAELHHERRSIQYGDLYHAAVNRRLSEFGIMVREGVLPPG
jgi:hypothetical protein